MKEMKLDRKEFNLLVNDILLDVKPVKLKISIANRLIEFFDKKKQERIAELEAKLAESEKEHELLIDQFEEETEKLRKQIKQESDARKRFIEANNQ